MKGTLLLVWLIALSLLVINCGGGPPPTQPVSETPGTATPGAGEETPTPIEVLPTDTPVPPPPTPSPLPAEEVEMITIPAGEFTMGSEAGDDDERPAHTVFVNEFKIDKYEVTNEQFAKFVEETGYVTGAEQAGEGDSWRTYAVDKDRHPVVKVTWDDAVAYCQWAGKRLPTEAEWEKAARGSESLVYPWGKSWDPAKANSREGGYRGTTVVGSFPEGASPYGVMDMAGNVWEWTSDWYDAYPGSTSTSEYYGEQFKVTRGGAWFSTNDLLRGSNRSATSTDARNDDLGFRCAK